METTFNANLLNALNGGAAADQPKNSNELAQEQFFELMLAQLKNQDPTKPLDGQEYLGQLAQFSTVNGIQRLEQSFNQLSLSLQSMQALQASSLVGRSVLVDGNTVSLSEVEPVQGRVKLTDDVKDLTVIVQDASGREVRRMKLGEQPAGSFAFTWDGLNDQGAAVAPGSYQFKVEGTVNGTSRTFETQVQATVESVSLGASSQGITLHLAGLGEYSMSQIKEIL